MNNLWRYLAALTTGRIVLWCYAIWYVVNVAQHLDPRPRLWLTSAGVSVIIGIALILSTRSSGRGAVALDRWQVVRLFLMPFCVSSFSALVKDAGYLLVFPPTLRENLIGFAWMALFLAVVQIAKRTTRIPCVPPQGAGPPGPDLR